MKIIQLKCDGIEQNPAVAGSRPVFSYLLEGEAPGCRQQARRVTVFRLPEEKSGGVEWDSGWIESPKTWGIAYEGKPLAEMSWYRVRVDSRLVDGRILTAVSDFGTALIASNDIPAEWIGCGPLLRTSFTLTDRPAFAKIAVTGLGYFELFINGQRVGEDTLSPSYTWYEKRIEYLCWDVRDYLRQGVNAIGISLGSHWKQTPDCREDACYQRGCYYSGPLKAKALLRTVYEDGGERYIRTDSSWKSAQGPVVYAGVYDGELYDAGLEKTGYSLPDYDDSGWESVMVLDKTEARMVCSALPPIRPIRRIPAASVTRLANGDFVADFGVNIAGRCVTHIDVPAGQKVTLRYAELLSAQGGVDQRNLRWAKACDTYLSAGRPADYEPRFTYHGFRYVQISGVDRLTEEDITAVEVRSAVERIGRFACSEERLNLLHDCMQRTISNNLHSIPTDCCQRDERQGWLGDGQIANEAAIANFDMQFFYRKWLEDIADSQNESDGNLPFLTAPAWAGGEGLAWTCAYYEIVYSLYRFYDDLQAVERHYGGLRRYFEYLESREDQDGLLTLSGLGDWLAPEPTEEANIRDALYYRFAQVMAVLAGALNRPEEEARYAAKAGDIRAAYNRRYYSPHLFTDKSSGYYGTCYYVGQAANAIPLAMGIPDEGDRSRIVEKLLYELTESMGGLRLTTGFIGTKALFEALTEIGRDDLVLALLRQDEYPSYGFMLRHGATTIWERWQFRTDNEMNSHCHPPLAAPDTWFYRVAAGLRGHCIREDGLCEFRIEPADLPFQWAEASQKTPFGEIAVSWKRTEKGRELQVRVPPNAEAAVCLNGRKYQLGSGLHVLEG